MQPQIITVHNIEKAIEDVGVMPYANTLVRNMAGDYFYIEADLYDAKPQNLFPYQNVKEIVRTDVTLTEHERKWWVWSVWHIPMRLAWFVIDALRLKAQVSDMGTWEHREHNGTIGIYLTPGTEFMGMKIEKLTEIPAELRPVVVEKL